MKGTQRRLQCPKCGKAFFSWRPEDLPGAPVKCYFCGTQFEDEAAKRKPAPAPAAQGAVAAVAAATTPAAEGPPAAEPAKPS
jgi:DNA-directed RNA polymerase subunit RPC12/RpoP